MAEPLNATAVLDGFTITCGCGVADTDSDNDGTADCGEPTEIVTSSISGNISEDSTTATFDVKLNSPPDGNVVLNVSSSDNDSDDRQVGSSGGGGSIGCFINTLMD